MNGGEYDPDPWTLAMLALTAVGVTAQVIGTVSTVSANRQIRARRISTVHFNNLKDQINDTCRALERTIKFVATLHSNDRAASDHAFRFGDAAVDIERDEITTFRGLFERMALHVSAISSFTLGIIEYDYEFAQKFGIAILDSLGDIRDRIHSMQSGEHTIGQVLDECLLLLREFERILSRLDREN